ncbi:MAG: MFS transporter [Proteobacteria bacterium]|nr:MFS transporter [Pseudomonadota bacterium]
MTGKTITNKKQILSWCLIDFANSSYSAVISAVIFPVYFANLIVGNADGLGDLWWGRAVSLSMFITAILSPVLGGIADYSGRRKTMLYFFIISCSLSVAFFTFLQKGDIYGGFLLIVFANISMESSIVFYNSFLPMITPSNYLGRVSSWGFGLGYGGSILSLLLSLFLAKNNRYDLIWLSVSIFFLIFSVPSFIYLPKDERKSSFKSSVISGLGFVFEKIMIIKESKDLKRFLFAYFLYGDGINTVIAFSTIFAVTSLGFSNIDIIKLFILVQVTALIGSFAFAKIIDIKGPKRVISLSLIFWITVTVSSYLVINKNIFFIIACIAGLGLGTIQSASRTLYTYFIPEGAESEYFGIYSLVGKTSSILGPLLFGQISALAKSQRPAILSVSIFFLMGLLLLYKVKMPQKVK